MNPTGESVKIFIISRPEDDHDAPTIFLIEVIEFIFASRKCTPVSTVVLNWKNICDVARYDYVMLDGFGPTVNASLLYIPFKTGLFGGQTTKGAIVLDWKRHLILLSSFHKYDEAKESFDSPSYIVNDHVLYVTGRSSDCPSICSIHLWRFNDYWRDCGDPTSWVISTVNPDHATSFPLPRPSSTPDTILLSTYPSNWLDLEKARGRSDPCLSRSFHLHFSEWPSVPGMLSLGQFSLDSNPHLILRPADETGTFVDPDLLPSRHGRFALCTLGRDRDPHARPQTLAIALLPDSTSSGVLEHLDNRIARQIIMEYYGSAIITSSRTHNSDAHRTLPDPGGFVFVFEQYD
ncbi:hypothetical protein DFH11DRAFT_163057 [Phellopilus nigrolimitatus]|nr:hypothetical protein DFH11DRAFT_163057 [Phellopilus nigrolimitatus]